VPLIFSAGSTKFDLQGLVDLDVEIAKAEKKLDLARLNLDKVVKVESQPDYEDTVPANVRLANEEKACDNDYL
jgi:valyl-tRNA synthetase